VSVERNLLISLLKLTEKGTVEQETVKKDTRLPASVVALLLRKLQNENLIYFQDGSIASNTPSRLKIAIKALSLGADLEQLSHFLRWQEFEDMAALALELNGYAAQKNVRFKHGGRRWEIDAVGCKKPLVVCIDCKHWHHGMHPSTLQKMAAAQSNRVNAFAENLPNTTNELPCTTWEKAQFIPVIVSLIQTQTKFVNQVPVVSVLQLQDFINQLPLHLESVKHFSREFTHL